MNFINDLIKLRTIFFIQLIFSLIENPVFSNDLLTLFPLKSTSFVLPQSISTSSITDLTFLSNGLMNISTSDAIYTGDGINWDIIELPGMPQTVAHSQILYVYTDKDAGIISCDQNGNRIFNSFSGIFKKNGVMLTEVTDLKIYRHEVYLVNDSKLYHLKNDSVILEESDFKSGKIFSSADELILFNSAEGFKKFCTPGSDNNIPYPNFIPDYLFSLRDGYLSFSKTDNRFVLLDRYLSTKGEWQPGIKEKVLFAEQSDKFLYLLTDTNELYFFSVIDRKKPVFTDKIKLNDSQIKAIKVFQNKIWLIYDGKISCLEYPPVLLTSSFRNIGENITSSMIIRNNLFIGSEAGLFLVTPGTGTPQILLNNSCRKIMHLNDNLIIHGDNGLSFINENFQAIEFFTGTVRDVIPGPGSDQLTLSLTEKIISISFNKDLPGFRTVFSHPVQDAENIQLFKDHLYLEARDSLLRINVSEQLKKPELIPIPTGEKIVRIFTYLDKLYLLTKKKIYLLNEDLSLTEITTCGFSEDYTFYDISVIHENSCWLTTRDRSGKFQLFHDTGSFTFHQVDDPQFNPFYPFSVTADISNRYLISSGNTCFLFNTENSLKPKPDPSYHILISKIISGNTILYDGIGYQSGMTEIQDRLFSIPYPDRMISFCLSSTNYSQTNIFYRYILSGKEDYTSSWSSSPLIMLNNLKKGNYSITIESIDTHLNTSESIILSFNILPPAWQRWWAITLYMLMSAFLSFIAYKHFRIKETQNLIIPKDTPVSELITKENPKSELFNEDIQATPSDKSKWEKFETVTVLFSDIQGFTKIAEQMNPETLIDELDTFFFHFDSVCEKYSIEKIKTIGDAYMAAGGIPKQNSTNPIEVVLAALEMQTYMKQLKNTRTDIWDLRIGIHSGPVIGGIIGHKKRSYDIWGDTVNTASRMESSGEPGKVNISGLTHNLIKDFFICEYRGKLPVKYKGNIDMYFVKGLRPELSVNLGTLPNRIFSLKLQLLRLKDIEELVFRNLQTNLPDNYYYHSFDTIKLIYAHAGLLSKAENLDIEGDMIIKTTILLLFSGLAINYLNYENKSAEYARQILPDFKYNDKQISVIHNLILFAKLLNEPVNHFEKIIYDLKTEYFGRSDYLKLYKLQYLEYVENVENISIREWKKQQITLLQKHDFYTLSAKRLREVTAENQIKNIESDNWE